MGMSQPMSKTQPFRPVTTAVKMQPYAVMSVAKPSHSITKDPLQPYSLNTAENIRAEFASSAAFFDLRQNFIPFAVEGAAQSNIVGCVVCTEHGAFRIYTCLLYTSR